MHVHKMFKRMHKKHGGPPPPGMWHHMMHKPHGMWHHMMPKPHEMWPHMEHHKMPPPMYHKTLHKMHKKHHHKKHRGRSSSSSSSSSESDDESLVEGIDKVQIGDEQQGKENPGNVPPPPSCDGVEVCKEKFKCKKGKHFKSKGNHKKEKCKSCFKRMYKEASNPWMQCSSMGEPPCRDSRYNKGIFNLPPQETSHDTEEGRGDNEQNIPVGASPRVRLEESKGHDKSRVGGQQSLKRGPRRGDSVDYFMQSIAEQLKRLPESKIAEAKLKILEVVNSMQLDTSPEQQTQTEDMNIESQEQREPQLATQSTS